MCFCTFYCLSSYQNIRSISIYLSLPLFDLAPAAMPPKPNVAVRVCRRQDRRFYLPFTFLDISLSYLSRNRISKPYKYPCARLAEKQATAAPFPISSLVCVFFSLISLSDPSETTPNAVNQRHRAQLRTHQRSRD